ncbi:13550_t:CDS:2 [Funneliformis geosporum]|uniref:10361_t:CDS:1 n=1 Tax=Funneliformis geosporum TaxID=1117311 RepID=A0A9W4SXE5_9GLOM|nr:10361_t:CDS:2 [Funneliformis geosporum]CAI2187164.1 13550_t:CDS:2 [Funneliformis geosporum]
MESKAPMKVSKYLLVLQIFIILGIGICEVVQLAVIDYSQKPIIEHTNDWDYLIGYTNSPLKIILKVYYWIVILASIILLGLSLNSFEKRWKNLQNYDDKPKQILLFILWSFATIPNVIILFSTSGVRICTRSTFPYPITTKLLDHCNAYIISLLLAYLFIITSIIQVLYQIIILNHQKKNILPPKLQEPKKMKVRRNRHVSKKRRSTRSIFTDKSIKLSTVNEDDEEMKSSKSSNSGISGKSGRSIKSNNQIQNDKSDVENDENVEVNDEKTVYSNV